MGKKRKAKKRSGPPGKLRSPQQRRKFLQKLRENMGSKGAACRKFGIGNQTLLNECSRDPEFAAQVEAAREQIIEDLSERAVKLGLDGDGPMLRFLLPRLDPKRWAETQQVEHRGHVEVNHEVKIGVIEDDGWYQNGPTPPRLAAPASDPAIPGAVQGGDVRPAVGQNGSGPNGHH